MKRVVFGLMAAWLTAACGQGSFSEDDGEPSRQTQAISAADAQVLQFEAAADWRADVGVAPGNVPGTAGNGLSLTGQGYRRVVSVPLDTLGQVSTTATLRVKVNQNSPYWQNTVEVILRLPSAQLWYQPLGTLPVAPGTGFDTLSFSIPSSVRTKLNGNYSDLEVLIAVNGPASVFVLDDLNFGVSVVPDLPPPPESGWPDVYAFQIRSPLGTDVEGVPLLSSESMQLTPNVVVQDSGKKPGTVVNAGVGTLLLEPDVHTGPIRSQGKVELRDRVVIVGDIESNVEINDDQAHDVEHTGRQIVPANLAFVQNSYEVAFPQTLTQQKVLQNNANGTATPGGYSKVWVYSGSTLKLASGTYAVDDFGVEPSPFKVPNV